MVPITTAALGTTTLVANSIKKTEIPTTDSAHGERGKKQSNMERQDKNSFSKS